MRQTPVLLLLAILLYACNNEPKTAASPEPQTAAAAVANQPTDYNFADPKYSEIGKKGLANLSSGDIDAWMADFADDAVYRWNNMDSLIGKAAIVDYWKKRRTDVIDSISFSSQIWLAINVINPLTPGQLTGNYAMSWTIVDAKYKTGKSMRQRIHTVYHFNANDKIDRVFQYLDRGVIAAAMSK